MDGFEERLRRLGFDMDAARARAESASQFRRGVEAVRGRGSRDGVEVVVDSAGNLVDVDLGRDLVEVRDAVIAAYQLARQDAGRAVVGLAGDAFGEGDESVERLRSMYGVEDEAETRDAGAGVARRGILRPGGGL